MKQLTGKYGKFNKRWLPTTLATLGLAGAISGCNGLPLEVAVNAQAQSEPPSSTATASPSPSPSPTPTETPLPTFTPTAPPLATATPWPTPTPWPTLARWQPHVETLSTLTPLPSTLTPVPVVVGQVGAIPVNYSPPDGVDVFGNTILRWEYHGQLAADEYFDIKIKPLGDPNSAFVDWTKENSYELRSWGDHWQPGLYTWQIGIVKGRLEGDTKHFIADTGRDSAPFLIKWQAVGYHDSGGGGSSSSGGGGGGGQSGGS